MIDYRAAAYYADHVRAFAIIESTEDETATGDGGRALGLLQMHPATFMRYYRPVASTTDTWTQAFIKACASYLSLHAFRAATPDQQDLIVQAWKLGEGAVFSLGERDPAYVSRWKAAYQKITGRGL
jgi:hypothetical protein